jgi:tetratricopeptide (TPR) repeat protein
MMQFGICPRCQFEISEERKKSNPVVCDSCGLVLSNTDADLREAIDSRFIKFACGIAIALVAGFMQVVSWDNHAIEVIPLQIKSLVGASSNDDLEKMAAICMDRKKYDCVEQQYTRLAEGNPANTLRLGKFQMSRARYQEAVNTYRNFFAKGGVDLEGSYNFARALGQVGQIDEAAKYYTYVIDAKPDVLQVTVVQNYVRLLMVANRLDQAKQLIEGVRKKNDASAYFMEDEYQKITGKSGPAAKS